MQIFDCPPVQKRIYVDKCLISNNEITHTFCMFNSLPLYLFLLDIFVDRHYIFYMTFYKSVKYFSIYMFILKLLQLKRFIVRSFF